MARFYFCVFCLILLAAGCGETVEEKAMEKKIEEATGGDAEVDLSKKGMKVTGETEGGKYTFSTGESIEISKDFPADVLIYRPSKTISSMKIPEGYSVSLTTRYDMPKVTETYKREMKAKGWSEEASMNIGAQSMLAYKKDSRAANIMIAPMDDETRITVTVTME